MKRNTLKKTVAFVLAMTLVTGGMPVNVPSFLTGGTEIVARAGSEGAYQEASWNGTSVVYTAKTATSPTTLANDTTVWTDGNWYVVPAGGVEISSRITVTGTVNLILTDGATLTAPKGITVATGNTLNIACPSFRFSECRTEIQAKGSIHCHGSIVQHSDEIRPNVHDC